MANLKESPLIQSRSHLMIKYMNVGWDINHALNCL